MGWAPSPVININHPTPMTVRFMEGEALKKIKILYPNDKFIQVGYFKLDLTVNGEEPSLDFKIFV
jgi:hypothetical protein